MIKSIELTNFQSHKKTILEFHPGVNIIMGRSRGGKSAVFRGIRWLIKNKPGGDKFRSHWGGDTKIVLHTDTDIIERLKTDKENKYILNNSVYKAFGAGVPEDIEKVLNLNEVNFQSQFEVPFLLSENYSSGDVAKHFNKIAHIDKIDTATKTVKGKLRGIEQELISEKKKIKDNRKLLQKFENLDKFESQLEILEIQEENKITYYKNIQELTSLSSKLENLEKKKQKYFSLPKIEKIISVVEKLWEDKKIALTQLNSLLSLQERINTQKKKIKTKNNLISLETKVISILSDLELQRNKKTEVISLMKKQRKLISLSQRTAKIERFVNYSVIFRKLEKDFQNQKEINKQITLLTATQARIRKNKEKQKGILLLLNDMEKKFHSSFPDVCPLCGKTTNK